MSAYIIPKGYHDVFQIEWEKDSKYQTLWRTLFRESDEN